MRIFTIQTGHVHEHSDLSSWHASHPQGLAGVGYCWISCTREELAQQQAHIQSSLQMLCGVQLVDLHISDLLNQQLPSHYDYTSQYDVLVFRRLAPEAAPPAPSKSSAPAKEAKNLSILQRIDTSPVGFAVFENTLLTVHPSDCAVRNSYASKLLATASAESRAAGARLPTSPADLMLRIVNLMVDGYLALRKELTHQLDDWQTQLIDPQSRFHNWPSLLDTRLALHQLDEICEEQRSCIQDWIEAIKTWPEVRDVAERRERDLLQVRSRDVLEHIERVVHHVRRLEQSAETAVQMHFSAQSHRTNNIMRTLTALTAIFLPLNLIAAIFGMNFEFIPLLHMHAGFWWALGSMALIAGGLSLVFWRKRYLARTSR